MNYQTFLDICNARLSREFWEASPQANSYFFREDLALNLKGEVSLTSPLKTYWTEGFKGYNTYTQPFTFYYGTTALKRVSLLVLFDKTSLETALIPLPDGPDLKVAEAIARLMNPDGKDISALIQRAENLYQR